MASMRSLAHSIVPWGRNKLNSTITIDVESGVTQDDGEDQRTGIELTPVFDTVSETGYLTNRWNGRPSQIGIPINQSNSYSNTIKIPRLLPKHFNFMYNIGIFPSKYDGQAISRTKCILQQILFWIVAVLAILDSLRLTKYFIFSDGHRGDLYSYTITSYMLIRAFKRLTFLYILVCNRAKILKLQKSIDAIANAEENILNSKGAINTNAETVMLCSVWILTLVGSFVVTVFGSASISNGWSIEDTYVEKSYSLRKVMFVWTFNATKSDRIEDSFFNEDGDYVMSYMSGFLGISCAILELVGLIFDNSVDDILLLVVITFHVLVNSFKFEIVEQADLKECSDKIWRHYRQLQNISEDVNFAFGMIFKFTHFSNLLRFGYFLLLLTGDKIYDTYFLLFTVVIFKVGITYYLAMNISTKNKSFRRWVQQTYLEQPCIIVGNKNFQTSLVLDELTTNPIGLGSDSFHFDESFLMKFTGLVASYFMFLAESKAKSSM